MKTKFILTLSAILITSLLQASSARADLYALEEGAVNFSHIMESAKVKAQNFFGNKDYASSIRTICEGDPVFQDNLRLFLSETSHERISNLTRQLNYRLNGLSSVFRDRCYIAMLTVSTPSGSQQGLVIKAKSANLLTAYSKLYVSEMELTLSLQADLNKAQEGKFVVGSQDRIEQLRTQWKNELNRVKADYQQTIDAHNAEKTRNVNEAEHAYNEDTLQLKVDSQRDINIFISRYRGDQKGLNREVEAMKRELEGQLARRQQMYNQKLNQFSQIHDQAILQINSEMNDALSAVNLNYTKRINSLK